MKLRRTKKLPFLGHPVDSHTIAAMGRFGPLKMIWIVTAEYIRWREQKTKQNRRGGQTRTEFHHFLFHNLNTADNFCISEASIHKSRPSVLVSRLNLLSANISLFKKYLEQSPSMDSCVCPVSLFLSCRFHFEWLKQPKKDTEKRVTILQFCRAGND